MNYETDHLGSDDLEAFLEQSRFEYEEPANISKPNGANSVTAGNSRKTSQNGASRIPTNFGLNSTYLERRKDLQKQLAGIESEIQEYDEEIRKLSELKALRVEEKREVERELERLRNESIFPNGSSSGGGAKGKQRGDGIDYHSDDFTWVSQLKARMKSVFGIASFRLCQQGACNANVDGRDIVCIMPTGGGKSLTYQLPALIIPGCTIVISPLIALIMDQVLHLREAGVQAAMLTGATPKEETNTVYTQLRAMADGQLSADKEIKLLYVTPERVAKTKRFMSILDKLYKADRLARFVIDEAHCVSQMGHSFRPDYRNLHVLRQMYPRVPIMALSATCPPKVLDDVLKALKMKPIVDGRSAHMSEGTVYFTAPLYRKNLHYKVLPKPASAAGALKAMVDYILKEHRDDSGIVYCLTKKDSEEVAKGLSDNKIKSGVYHADVNDAEKEGLHRRWREGKVQVVCATIAFGLGIDKGNVRFVIHHSISKTLEAYYQESGRAGRDGKDADCIMFYRPQDAMRLSAMVCTDIDGQSKLYNILRFAQNLTECRKIMFAKCFSHTSQLSMSSWATDDTDALTPCVHCDNCARQSQPDTFERKDVTVQAWQILKVVDEIRRNDGRVTMRDLVDLVRGTGKGKYDIHGGGRRRSKGKEQGDVDLDVVANGKVELSKDDTEYLIIELLVSGYLTEDYHSTAYQTNVYLKVGPRAIRLTRMSKEGLAGLSVDRIECSFGKVGGGTKRGRKSVVNGGGNGSTKGKGKQQKEKEEGQMKTGVNGVRGSAVRRKRGRESSEGEDEEIDDDVGASMNGFIVDDDEEVVGDEDGPSLRRSSGPSRDQQPRRSGPVKIVSSDEEDEGEAGVWSFNLRQSHSCDKPPPPKRQKNDNRSVQRRAETRKQTIDDDILILSSD